MKYQEELQEFKEFLKTYTFTQKEIIEQEDGTLLCDGIIIKDENGYITESEKWINVGYSLSNPFSKLLSNLFPYEFEFKNIKLNSIECFFQGIKFKDIEMQHDFMKYSGKEAVYLKQTTDYDWKETGIIYWNGKEIQRDSLEYKNLTIELYISAIQNKFYRNAIKNCKLPIVHAIGETDKTQTVFTRYEFEYMLNALHEFLTK